MNVLLRRRPQSELSEYSFEATASASERLEFRCCADRKGRIRDWSLYGSRPVPNATLVSWRWDGVKLRNGWKLVCPFSYGRRSRGLKYIIRTRQQRGSSWRKMTHFPADRWPRQCSSRTWPPSNHLKQRKQYRTETEPAPAHCLPGFPSHEPFTTTGVNVIGSVSLHLRVDCIDIPDKLHRQTLPLDGTWLRNPLCRVTGDLVRLTTFVPWYGAR